MLDRCASSLSHPLDLALDTFSRPGIWESCPSFSEMIAVSPTLSVYDTIPFVLSCSFIESVFFTIMSEQEAALEVMVVRCYLLPWAAFSIYKIRSVQYMMQC